MATTVNNPTNTKLAGALPFTTEKHRLILETRGKSKPVDPFNDGKDYPDEGAPLLTKFSFADEKPSVRMSPGMLLPPTAEQMKAVQDFDGVAQGGGIRYLREAVVMDIDAKLVISTESQMRKGVFREAHYPSMIDYIKSDHYKRLRESAVMVQQVINKAKKTKLREAASKDTPIGIRFNPNIVSAVNAKDKQLMKRFRESLRESDVGAFSGQLMNDWDGGLSFEVGGRVPPFTPLISGPYNKQLYYFDYLDMHSKAFEAWTHNPIAKRIVSVLKQFVLGKGVKLTVTRAERSTGQFQVNQQTGEQMPTYEDYTEECQNILDRHWLKNSLRIRSKQILQDLIVFGEMFIRYFEASWGLRLRELDPSTVWEIITDPDDVENEFYIHQQYPTQYQWYVDLPVPTIKFIIRQVPALHYFHMKINATATEKRGRSELFAVLGYLRRLKEFIDDRIVRNKVANLFVLDVAVEGDDAQVQRVQGQFANQVPMPGSFFIHNKAAELQGVPVEIGSADSAGDADLILGFIAMGSGVPMQYLGMQTGAEGGKAGALVGTEPAVKTFEDYQELMEEFFYQDGQRVFVRASEKNEIPANLDIKLEATYPALAEENRSEKLKDLAFGESMSWWSHRRVAAAAAKEMLFTSYDYDEEQEDIANEDARKQVLLNTAYQQVTKGVDSLQQKSQGKGSGVGGGGTSSGSSGKGASGMGFGRALGSVRESAEAPTTPAGTSTFSHVSSYAAPANASRGGGKAAAWPIDPRDVASTIKREAANLRFDRHEIGRRDRVLSPEKRRDQQELSGKITDARKSLRSGNFNHESQSVRRNPTQGSVSRVPVMRFPREVAEGGPGSGPRKGAGRQQKDKGYAEVSMRDVLAHADKGKMARMSNDQAYEHLMNAHDKAVEELHDKGHKEVGLLHSGKISDWVDSRYDVKRGLIPGKSLESKEPFKPQDGDRLQRPRVEHVEDHQAHPRYSGRRLSPSGFGANKKERI